MKLHCQWCGSSKAPFHKLNVYMYGNERFICEDCYNELEIQQKMFDECEK